MTKHNAILKLLLPLLLVVGVLLPVTPVSAVTYQSYENYTTGDDASVEIYTFTWVAQTFTTNATSHTVNVIRLKMFKEGTPGVLTASIRATNSSGAPTGTDLSSGTFDATLFTTTTSGSWYDVTVDEITLSVNTTYAIVCRGTGTDSVNNIHWMYDTAGATYSGGHEWVSSNAGALWTADTDEDYMFEIFGLPAMEIYGANVFSDYLVDGDWIITVKLKNVYEPYYSTLDSKDAFLLQLLSEGGSLIAQLPLTHWDYKPCSLYLGADLVNTLEWGVSYQIRMNCTQLASQYASYTLTSADWRGNDLTRLDDWCIATAHAMETYYDEVFVISTAAQGDVLNEDGGVIFIRGIPYLDQVRPNIFELASYSPEWQTTEWTAGYEESLPEWEAAIGSDLASSFTDLGNVFGLSGKWVGILICMSLYIGVAIGGVALGNATLGMAVATPILIAGFYLRFIPFAILGIAIAFLLVILVWHIWWRAT